MSRGYNQSQYNEIQYNASLISLYMLETTNFSDFRLFSPFRTFNEFMFLNDFFSVQFTDKVLQDSMRLSDWLSIRRQNDGQWSD